MAANTQYSTNAHIQESLVTTKAMVDVQFLMRKVCTGKVWTFKTVCLASVTGP